MSTPLIRVFKIHETGSGDLLLFHFFDPEFGSIRPRPRDDRCGLVEDV